VPEVHAFPAKEMRTITDHTEEFSPADLRLIVKDTANALKYRLPKGCGPQELVGKFLGPAGRRGPPQDARRGRILHEAALPLMAAPPARPGAPRAAWGAIMAARSSIFRLAASPPPPPPHSLL